MPEFIAKPRKKTTKLTLEQQKELVRQYKRSLETGELLTQSALATQFGISQMAVSYLLRGAGIHTRTREEANRVRFDVDEAIRLYRSSETITLREIAKAVGSSTTAIYTHLERHGILRGMDPVTVEPVPVVEPEAPPVAYISIYDWCLSVEPTTTFVADELSVGDLKILYIDLNAVTGEIKPDSIKNRLVIYSDEWNRRTKQCQSLILAKLNRFTVRYGARECDLKQVDRAEAQTFLEEYHLQGSNNLGIAYFGLYRGDELLGLLSMGRHSRNVSDNKIVLDRLCFKSGTQITGGASKLFKAAIEWAKDMKYEEIVSFSDNRWTQGLIYEVLKFDMEKEYHPDYMYIKYGIIHSKQSQKKGAVNCPDSLTEFEWASQRGLRRIYDCGKKRWTFNLQPGTRQTLTDSLSERAALQHQRGDFKHSHIRGYYSSSLNNYSIYYGSSYELRCMYLLDRDPLIKSFRRGDVFRGAEQWRNPDLMVEFMDGKTEIWEVKPEGMLAEPAVMKQIQDSTNYAKEHGLGFRVWSEKDSGLTSVEIIEWAKKFLAETTGDTTFIDRAKESIKRRRDRHYAKESADKVEIPCDYCRVTHIARRKSYNANIAKNGHYVCERLGGHLSGSKPKPSLHGHNPYAVEGRKQCSVCKVIKEISLFDKRAKSWDGLSSNCKECASKRNRELYLQKISRRTPGACV